MIHAGKRPLDPGGDKDMVCGLDVCDEIDELDDNSFSDTYVNDREGDFTDEVTGVTLLRDDVAKARMEEMKWYEKYQAFDEVTDETCVLRTGRKPISCRWRDINKGDSERVEVRSRLAAREIKQKGIDSYFAGTAPLALVRCVLSRAATLSKTGKGRQLMVPDAKRAFLHADALTETCVKPPHLREAERCWLLKKCMCGTLPAAAGWQHFVQKVGTDIGLLSSSCSPCAFGHSTRDLDMVVHGDDFLVVGDGDDFDWLFKKLNEKLELVQKARLGPGYDSEATVWNRCVTYSDSGLTWEADPRHAELALAELGLQPARPQTSPGGTKPSAPLDQEELESDGQTAYHSVSARLAYQALDRPDIAFACKECSRAVGKATRADLTRLKRIGRDLLCTPRVVWEFTVQYEESIVLIDGLSDADAAGCPKTRRSTSGGCLRVGQDTLATCDVQRLWTHVGS